MLQFPERGFVYDKNARCALWALNGAAEAINTGETNGKHTEFERFFIRWKRVAEPIIDMLREQGVNLCDIGASRTVDKFLWLRGTADPARSIADAVAANVSQEQRELGEKIFNAGTNKGYFV